MRTTAIVAEYNPLHFGHIRQIEYVKNTLKSDRILVVMSGNFTQRGEIAVLNKYKRATEAIKAGADLVIELPTVFSTANAEIFAKGAIKLINSLNIVDDLCFGIESGSKEDYLLLAKKMNSESEDFKKLLREKLEEGISLCKAKFETVKSLDKLNVNADLLSSPNNILGLEYTKALLALNSKIKIEPLIRENTHGDKTLKSGITSALSIREYIKSGKIKEVKNSVPPFVYEDLIPYQKTVNDLILSSLITANKEELALISDCTEGLENRLKAFSKNCLTLDKFVKEVSTKRYTESRIKRILISNFLGIKEKLLFDCLKENLYIKILAVKETDKEFLSELSLKSDYPVLTRKSDVSLLSGTALECFLKDVLANDLYNLISKEKTNEFNMILV